MVLGRVLGMRLRVVFYVGPLYVTIFFICDPLVQRKVIFVRIHSEGS
jgi:hypothetical protein